MSDFVLVHGAWCSDWIWTPVKAQLEANGHTVYTPTLTGLGRRASELNADVGLEHHISDVGRVLETHDIQSAVLVLFSYAGMLGPGICARHGARIFSTVYLDAPVPFRGESLYDIIATPIRERQLQAVHEAGDGWRVPPPDPTQFGNLLPSEAALLRERMTAQPLKSFTDKSDVDEGAGQGIRKHYAFAVDRQPHPLGDVVAHVTEDPAWRVTPLTGGHCMMLTKPDALVSCLLEATHDGRTERTSRDELGVEFDPGVGAWFGRTRPIATEELARCVFRFDELPASSRAFIDAVVPGHERTLMGAIGGGTSEEDLASTVETAENYHVDFIRAAPGNGAALHSHDTEETFICLTGTWRVTLGDRGEMSVDLGCLDGIACPSGVMRAFENTSGEEALMLSILGGKHPGHVVWAQSIRQELVAAHAK